MQPSKGLHNQVVKIVVPYCTVYIGGRSANKFRKSQTQKFADLNFSRFADLPQMWQFAYLKFEDSIF